MARIKYTLDFERVAVVQSGGKFYKVGDVIYFSQKSDGSLDIEIFLDPMIDKKLKEEIENAPHLLGIQSKAKIATNLILLP